MPDGGKHVLKEAARQVIPAAVIDRPKGYFPVPGPNASRPGAVFTGGSDLVVPQNTKDQFAATAVVGALTGAKWDTELARTMNYVPNKTTLAAAVSGEEGVAAMAAGTAHGRGNPNTPTWADGVCWASAQADSR